MTAIAIGARNSDPSPSASAVGTIPAAMAIVVITIGRTRSRQAESNASLCDAPLFSASMVNSTNKIEFLAANPMSINKPISADKSSELPAISKPKNAPARDKGNAANIVIGLKKLLNNSTITP